MNDSKLTPKMLPVPQEILNQFVEQHFASKKAAPMSIDQWMSSFESMGSDTDIAFVVFCMQIKTMDQRVAEQIKNVKSLSDARDVINKELKGLRELQAEIERIKGDDDEVGIQEFCEAMNLTEPFKAPSYEKMEQLVTDFCKKTYGINLEKIEFTWNEKNQKIEPSKNGMLISNRSIFGNHLKAQINNLESTLNKLDSDREISMISLNSNINKKGQYVEWLSNIMKRNDSMSSSVIGNLR